MAMAEDPVAGGDVATSTGSGRTADPAEAAFRAAYGEHLAEIWRFVRRRCDGSADADDVTAEVFAVAWRRRHDLPPHDEVRLWLYGVARKVLANQQRSARRRDRLHLRAAEAAMTAPAAHAGPADDSAGDALWAALASLDEDDRELLLLRTWDGLPVTDLAVLLACTPNAVSLRLHKARRRLAAALDALDAAGRSTDPSASRTSLHRSPSPEGGAR